MREERDAGDVADSPHGVAGNQLLVNWDAAAHGLDPERLESEIVGSRSSPGGDEQSIAAQLPAILELQHVVLAVALHGAHERAEVDVDAFRRQRRREGLAERWRLSGHKPRGPLDQGHLHAEAAERLAQLGSDGAAAKHEQTLGKAP
jgi:hypothetical protein